MDELNFKTNSPSTDPTSAPAPSRHRRPVKTQQIFKEKYLPFIILGAAALLCLSFIFGSMEMSREQSTNQTSSERINQLLDAEAQDLKERASTMAAAYDYENAMKLLASYSGGLANHNELMSLYNSCKNALSQMVVWDDLSEIPNLSFRTLVADLDKAVADPDRGSRYASRHITTDEFTRILEQLYDNGYVLVSLYDFFMPGSGDDNAGITHTSIRLPEGKKPVCLTLEGVNYYSHTEKCGGFADALVLNGNGELTCRLGDTEGAYDLVPLLNAFLAKHPDFSYEGARATVAVSGYEGLFGMDLDQTAEIQSVADTLRAQGYDIACYTYADMEYADFGAAGIREDLDKWNEKIKPLLGEVDILVYPSGGDIAGQEAYAGSKYDMLHEFGFRCFVGVDNGARWGLSTSAYVRQSRTLVTAANLTEHPEWYTGLFDAAAVLSEAR